MSVDINSLLKDVEKLIKNPSLAGGKDDREMLIRALKYVKQYAYLKELGKAVASMPDVVRDIEEVKAKLQRSLEESKGSPFYGHYEEQLAKLSHMEEYATTPDKFAEEFMGWDSSYERESLIKTCALIMADYYQKMQKFQGKPIFEMDGMIDVLAKYSIQNEQAKGFVEFIRNEKLMAELSVQVKRESAFDEQVVSNLQQIAEIELQTPLIDLYPLIDNPEFDEAISDVSEFIANAPKETVLPEIASKNKLINSLRGLFSEGMFPHEKAKQKKIIEDNKKKRAEYIEKASKKLKDKMENPAYREVIGFFMQGDSYESILQNQELESPVEIKKSVRIAHGAIDELNKANDEIKNKIEEQRKSLSPEARKAIDANGFSEVASMVQLYYHGEDYRGETQVKTSRELDSKNMSRVGASLCLALMVEEGQIPLEEVIALLGDKRAATYNLETDIANKVSSIRKRIAQLDPDKPKSDESFDIG